MPTPDVVSLGLAIFVVVVIWYRVATARSPDDLLRLSAMIQYSVVFVPMAFIALAVDEVFGMEFDEFRVFLLLAILALAIFLVSQYDVYVLTTIAAPILWETQNSLALNAAIILVFLSMVLLGKFFGSFLFRHLFANTIARVESEISAMGGYDSAD